jgi:hypothetical protein
MTEQQHLPQKLTVCIRKDYSKPVRPEALQLDGNSYVFERGWIMDADDPYPGEVAWIPCDPAYPSDAPTWIASGDLGECPIEVDVND